MKRFGFLLLAAAFVGGQARAGEKVEYAPPSAWVKQAAIPDLAPDADTGAIQLLLQDDQTRVGKDGDEFFQERAFKLRSAAALSGANIILTWRPDTETLVVHRLALIRDGVVIDLLAGGKTLTVLRREANLEAAMLDGELTATLQPEDIRVGDVLDYAYSLRRKDPTMQGRSDGISAMGHQGAAGRVRIRALWGPDVQARWRTTEGLGEPKLTRTAEGTELLIDREKITAPKPPEGAPARFRRLGRFELTTFRDWADVSAVMAPLYVKAAKLKPDSPLRAEAAKIRKAYATPKERAFAALKLVQDETRYVLIGLNLGGFVPADADVTWSRRFGDCKAKTVLLIALLNELGIEAQPMLVNTVGGDGLDEHLSMGHLFDHVLVRAKIGGQAYWLDGTRLGDRNLDDLPVPDVTWALPVQDKGATLERVPPKLPLAPQTEQILRLDLTAGPDAPAKVHAEYLLRDEVSRAMRLAIEQLGQADLDRYLRELWKGEYAWVEPKAVGQAYDPATGQTRLWVEGLGKLEWYGNGTVRDFDIGDSSVGYRPNFTREPGPNRDAPYAVAHPTFLRRSITITLPAEGRGFSILGGKDVDTSVAGVAYKRVSRLQGAALTIQTEQRSLADEFPASEAPAAEKILREISRTDVFLRTSARPAAAGPASDTPVAEPTDARGFAARGAGYLGQKAYDKAIADFTRAAELEPKQANHFYNRGAAHFEKGEDVAAMADFNQALKLEQNLVLALAARAELLLIQDKEPAARKDFERAVKLAPGNLDLQIRRADAYLEAGRPEAAIQYYDEALKVGAAREEYIGAAKCEARAKLAAAAEAALAECDALLKAHPQNFRAREGRAMALLRLGKLDDAVGEYDGLLARRADWPSSLYGRGLATLRKGKKEQAAADLKAAAERDPTIAQSFKRYGLAP